MAAKRAIRIIDITEISRMGHREELYVAISAAVCRSRECRFESLLKLAANAIDSTLGMPTRSWTY